ncbi:MAG: hypothetical protein ABSB41_12040 [Anaerolineales bacterium]|jgi:hypothetical protein
MINHILIPSILGITFLLAGCVPKKMLPATDTPHQAPIPIPNYSTSGVPQPKPILPPTPSMSSPNGSVETSQAFQFSVPVDSKTHALIAAKSALRGSFDYTKPLTVVSVDQANFGEASSRIGEPVNGSPDLQVWLVIYYNDEFQAHAPTPRETPSPPYRGCAFAIVNANDGLPVEIGGPLLPGIIAECDTGQH